MRTAIVVVLAGCTFARSTGTGPDGAVIDDAGNEVVTWTFDEAPDFRRPGAVLGETGVEPHGSLTPAAYAAGMVLGRGTRSQLWNVNQAVGDLEFSAMDSEPIAGVALVRTLDHPDLTRPAELERFGLLGPDNHSIALEGEVFLAAAGNHTFRLDADDVMFLEIAVPGTTAFTKVGVSTFVSPTDATFVAAAPGWHPFRIGMGQGNGDARVRVAIGPPNSASPVVIGRDRLRVRVDALRGLARSVFDRSIYAGTVESTTLDQAALATTVFNPLPPNARSDGSWSGRWAGQFYATAPGAYQFAIASDDGHEAVAENGTTSDGFSADASGIFASQLAADFVTGWNQIAVSLHQRGGPGALSVIVTAAPEAALVGHSLPVDRLRPAETHQRRLVAVGDPADDDVITNNSSVNKASTDIQVVGMVGEVSAFVDVTLDITAPRWEDLNVELQRPGNTTPLVLLSAGQAAPGGGRRFLHLRATDPAFVGAPIGGTWTARVFDTNSSGGNGTLHGAYVAIHTTGGAPTVATDATWTSEVVDLQDRPLVDVTKVDWLARTPRSVADVELAMRACDSPACDGEPWSAPIDNGQAPALTGGRRYLQAQVRLRCDGLRETELERLAITYRRLASN